MPFPEKPPGTLPFQKPSDGQTKAYQRVVNGKVVKVNSYGSKPTTSTAAAKKARLIPGRPRMAAQPGTYTHGRDIPGQKAVSLPEPQFPDPRTVPLDPQQSPQ